MPGPIVHIVYGLGVSLPLQYAAGEGRFTPVHAGVFATNCLIGPDIGVTLGAIVSTLFAPLGLGRLGEVPPVLFHDPLMFCITLGAPLAYLHSTLSQRLASLASRTHASAAWASIGFRQALMLTVAGGISHWSVDNIFEEDSVDMSKLEHTAFLRWAIGTGNFGRKAVDLVGLLVMLSLLVALLATWALIHWPLGASAEQAGTAVATLVSAVARLRTAAGLASIAAVPRAVATAATIGVISVTYLAWGCLRLYGSSPRVPVLGEEADVGALTYILVFLLLPQMLLCLSMHPNRPEVEGVAVKGTAAEGP